jgi:integrase
VKIVRHELTNNCFSHTQKQWQINRIFSLARLIPTMASSEYTWDLTPPESVDTRDQNLELLPDKSRALYEAAYARYVEWCTSNRVSRPAYGTDWVLLRFLKEKSSQYAVSSLYSLLAKLKSTIAAHDSIEIKVPKCELFLKKMSKNHTPKKSHVFEQSELEQFLANAPEDMLVAKVVATLSVFGALRKSELHSIHIGDITIKEKEGYSILVKSAKTNPERSFWMPWKDGKFLRKYLKLRPADCPSNLLLAVRGGKVVRQCIGIHSIAAIPSKVAEYLKLPEPEKYTGHAWRRTAATVAVDAGCDFLNLKKIGGWNFDSVAQGYIDTSVSGAKKRANFIRRPPSENIPNQPPH